MKYKIICFANLDFFRRYPTVFVFVKDPFFREFLRVPDLGSDISRGKPYCSWCWLPSILNSPAF